MISAVTVGGKYYHWPGCTLEETEAEFNLLKFTEPVKRAWGSDPGDGRKNMRSY